MKRRAAVAAVIAAAVGYLIRSEAERRLKRLGGRRKGKRGAAR